MSENSSNSNDDNTHFTALELLHGYKCPEDLLQNIQEAANRLVNVRVDKTLDSHVRDVRNETSGDFAQSVRAVKRDFNARLVPLANDEEDEGQLSDQPMVPTILNDTDEIKEMSDRVDNAAKARVESLMKETREKLHNITFNHEVVEVDLAIGKAILRSGNPDVDVLAHDVIRELNSYTQLWEQYGIRAKDMDPFENDDLFHEDEDEDWPQTAGTSVDYSVDVDDTINAKSNDINENDDLDKLNKETEHLSINKV